MKKTLMIILTIISSLFLFACKESESKEYTISFNDYMNTYIRVDFVTDSQEVANTIKDDVEIILEKYHNLTNNYDLPDDEAYSPNIKEINERIGQKIAIHRDLYDILVLSEEIKELTDGYFDIGVGKLVDLWKAQITNEYGNPVFPDNTMTETAFLETVSTAEAMDFSDSEIVLSSEDGIYYIETVGENLKLDLGAISKGYVTQKVREYLIEQDILYFMINSGTSSFVFGQNEQREGNVYRIGLENPLDLGKPYSVVSVKDTSLTTSGNFIQYVMYNDMRYHHIVSPITHLPMQYYHTLSLIADDAGILDALSTALFSMSPETLNQWLDTHQNELHLEVIRFNYDETITTHLIHTPYEEIVDE